MKCYVNVACPLELGRVSLTSSDDNILVVFADKQGGITHLFLSFEAAEKIMVAIQQLLQDKEVRDSERKRY